MHPSTQEARPSAELATPTSGMLSTIGCTTDLHPDKVFCYYFLRYILVLTLENRVLKLLLQQGHPYLLFPKKKKTTTTKKKKPYCISTQSRSGFLSPSKAMAAAALSCLVSFT